MAETNNTNSDSALGHLRVIELGDIPASYATRQLADLGADVIKIEPPGGDPNRLLPPFAGNIEHPERSLTFIHANANKRSIALDLARDSDREVFAKLLASAQLLVEATPLGFLEEFGFNDKSLRERFPALGDRFDHAVRPHRAVPPLQRQRCHRQRHRRVSLRPGRQHQRAMHGAEPSGVSDGGNDGGNVGPCRGAPCAAHRRGSAHRHVAARSADVLQQQQRGALLARESLGAASRRQSLRRRGHEHLSLQRRPLCPLHHQHAAYVEGVRAELDDQQSTGRDGVGESALSRRAFRGSRAGVRRIYRSIRCR